MSSPTDIERIFDQPRRRVGRMAGARDRQPRAIRSDAAESQYRLNAFRSICPDYSPRWLATMREAKAQLPTCVHILKDARRCGQPQLRGETFCRHHLPRDRMAELDKARLHDAQTVVDRCASPSVVIRALRRIDAVETRELRRLWSSGCWEVAGSTLYLHPGDEVTIRRRLLQDGVDIEDPVHCAYMVDNFRWASFQFCRGRKSRGWYERKIAWLQEREVKWLAGTRSSTDTPA